VLRPSSGRAQAELRSCSGRAQVVLRHAQECLPSAQVKAAAAHVQTLKQNQRKKELSLTYVVNIHDITHNHKDPPTVGLFILVGHQGMDSDKPLSNVV
jgi:hypothetical protein